MGPDDRLRDAFERSAPPAPDAPSVRHALGPAMVRARRTHRIRRGAAIATVGLTLAGGGAAAAIQLSGIADDPVESHVSMLPPPETTAEPTTTQAPAPPPAEGGSPAASTPSTDSSTPPSTPSTPDSTTTEEPPTTSTATDSTTTAPTTTASPGVPGVLSGPHSTSCGTVTFVFDTTVAVDDHSVAPGYTFSTQGEGSTEVEAKWSLGPADECQVAAHLEDGVLEIQFDEA